MTEMTIEAKEEIENKIIFLISLGANQEVINILQKIIDNTIIKPR